MIPLAKAVSYAFNLNDWMINAGWHFLKGVIISPLFLIASAPNNHSAIHLKLIFAAKTEVVMNSLSRYLQQRELARGYILITLTLWTLNYRTLLSRVLNQKKLCLPGDCGAMARRIAKAIFPLFWSIALNLACLTNNGNFNVAKLIAFTLVTRSDGNEVWKSNIMLSGNESVKPSTSSAFTYFSSANCCKPSSLYWFPRINILTLITSALEDWLATIDAADRVAWASTIWGLSL